MNEKPQTPAEEKSTPPATPQGKLDKTLRAGKKIFQPPKYPHGVHPALVPGVSIEDQRVRYGVDKPILVVVGALIVSFVAWGIAQPDVVKSVSGVMLTWTMQNLGWIFTVIAAGLLIFLLVLAFSRAGRIPLGLDGEKPEFSTGSWAAMLFAAGIGIALIFFGPYEPLLHYLEPRPNAYEGGTDPAIVGGLVQTALHWGLNAWAIYAIVGLSVAYFSFRRGRVPLMSSILSFITGDSNTVGSRIIDGLAIIATLFGTAASLGIGALQIARGAQVVTGWNTAGNTIAILIIMVLTIGTIISAVSGVSKGIRILSNTNMWLSVGLAFFFLILGPTAFLLNVVPGVVIDYVGELPTMLARNMSEGEDTEAFLTDWTIFYWAWWVSWSPFVGIFTAKISRGRTIRQFVMGVLLIPSSIIVLAFTILGGTAIYLEHTAGAITGGTGEMPAPEETIFIVLDHLPGGQIVAPLLMFMLAIFFITTADSASLVNSQLAQKGNPFPRRGVTVFWSLCMAGIAVVILLTGGDDALQGLQNLIVITALPFSVIIVLMCVGLWKALRSDPRTYRQNYQRKVLDNAVRYGLENYGDNFAVKVEQTEPNSEYSAGYGFDSTSEEATDWYQRTDSEGNPVPYDYETGEYLDPHGQLDFMTKEQRRERAKIEKEARKRAKRMNKRSRKR